MTLIASDHGVPPQKNFVEVEVRISDVNDNDPEFQKQVGAFSRTNSRSNSKANCYSVILSVKLNQNKKKEADAKTLFIIKLSSANSKIYKPQVFGSSLCNS